MMRYWPALSVTTVRTFSVSAGLAASTVTPGSTPPDASLTVPVRVPCANAKRRQRTSDCGEQRNDVLQSHAWRLTPLRDSPAVFRFTAERTFRLIAATLGLPVYTKVSWTNHKSERARRTKGFMKGPGDRGRAGGRITAVLRAANLRLCSDGCQ